VAETCWRTLREEAAFAQLIGNSPAFVDALNMVKVIASSEAPVVLFGETGSNRIE
jgi:transcriptional regulator with GAF, ATPase, and Fis domain